MLPVEERMLSPCVKVLPPMGKKLAVLPKEPTLKLQVVVPGQHGQKREKFHVHAHEEQTVR